MTVLSHPEILTESEIQEILSHRPACEGRNHQSGEYGHRTDECASWLFGSPCGLSWLLCDSRVRRLMEFDLLNCTCGTRHPSANYALVPIGGDDA